MRDIAHAGPHLLMQALNCAATALDNAYGKDATDRFAGCVQRFIRLAADPAYDDWRADEDQNTAYAKCGFDEFPPEMFTTYADWLARLVLSAYFVGIREALHPGDDPFDPKAIGPLTRPEKMEVPQ
jgi:hypothetical protein